MTPAWAQRQAEWLRDCSVSPDVCASIVDRLCGSCTSSVRQIRQLENRVNYPPSSPVRGGDCTQ